MVSPVGASHLLIAFDSLAGGIFGFAKKDFTVSSSFRIFSRRSSSISQPGGFTFLLVPRARLSDFLSH